MPVTYRPAREPELAPAEKLVVQSINDLTERHGFGPIAASRPPQFQAFSLNDDPDGLWVAEEAGQLLGFAFSWVSGDLWFLAELFVSPAHQGRGIGNELMMRTLQHAEKANVAHKALITFTFNTVSQALYIRHGLIPRLPIYFLKAAREVLLRRAQTAELRCEPLRHAASHLQSLVRIDAETLGISREKHHKFLMNDNATRGFLLYAGGDCVGYAYISSDGHIGPLAVVRPDSAGAAFRTAMNLVLESGSPQISAFLPGTSDAMAIAVAHGMRITFPMVLMSTQEFGNWTQYIPRNPGFM
ncbi:MAG TPA: GNAT family N-acetyltransferase [Xanthobacteraceae bacterium]|nr:GNAT family N-acetyltransferase [Xanthobacteraceae bacterium]